MPSYEESSKKRDNIPRGTYKSTPLGTAAFFGGRVVDLPIQYALLRDDIGRPLIERLGGTTLPKGPPVLTNTPLDFLGLSPYRTILMAMATGSMLKQNFTLLAIQREEMTPVAGVMISVFNTIFNGLNSLFFVCAQTSASVNGEHFPQTPLLVGASLYTSGIFIEAFSEIQRASFKKDPANKGKVYQGGLFGLSRHINYLGYTMWRSGYALAAGGWVWASVVAAFFTYDFTQRSIPVLQHYMEERYGEQFEEYEKAVPYKFIPYVW